jgi:hypothetical protein
VIHPITAVVDATSSETDEPDSAIQEEDLLAYVQLMDNIDCITG